MTPPPLFAGHTPDVHPTDVIKPISTPHATPFGLAHTTSDESESDASGDGQCERDRERETRLGHDTDSDLPSLGKSPLRASQWTGAPIRAIIPLPRRKIPLNGSKGPGPVDATSTRSVSAPVVGPTPGFASWVGQPRVWDLGSDSEDEDEGAEDSDGSGNGRSECCSYESITAAEGLAAWSFEELRVECYAQSLIARGTKPPPVVQPSLAIPPAFVPRIVQRS